MNSARALRSLWLGGAWAAAHALGVSALPPDVVIAADGSGDFTTIQAAVESIPRENRERRILWIKDGTYAEKVRVDAPFVTLRGQSRAGTRLAFSQAAADFDRQPDALGRAVLNLSATAHDFVLENLTVENTQPTIGPHAFAVFGLADRTVILDCDLLSRGADTLALWRGRGAAPAGPSAPGAADDAGWVEGGRSYHARLKVTGSVDFICPRGWCYLTDSTIIQVNPGATAAIWHDGSGNPDKKFVLRRCRFDGPEQWFLARHHHDAQFYLLDCTFSSALRDQAPYRVIYPLDGSTPSADDARRNRELDPTNVLGERAYFFNAHRAGGDYPWHRDNLAAAPGAPAPEAITARWTFAGSWDPERTDAPVVRKVAATPAGVELTFSERVTVKGTPLLRWPEGGRATYASGSGSTALVFIAATAPTGRPHALELAGGSILATEAAATLRLADLTLP